MILYRINDYFEVENKYFEHSDINVLNKLGYFYTKAEAMKHKVKELKEVIKVLEDKVQLENTVSLWYVDKDNEVIELTNVIEYEKYYNLINNKFDIVGNIFLYKNEMLKYNVFLTEQEAIAAKKIKYLWYVTEDGKLLEIVVLRENCSTYKIKENEYFSSIIRKNKMKELLVAKTPKKAIKLRKQNLITNINNKTREYIVLENSLRKVSALEND